MSDPYLPTWTRLLSTFSPFHWLPKCTGSKGEIADVPLVLNVECLCVFLFKLSYSLNMSPLVCFTGIH